MTKGLLRCRFVIENVEREVPEAKLSPQPAKKRSRKNTPKKTPDLPDFGDLDTFLASSDFQNSEPSGQSYSCVKWMKNCCYVMKSITNS